MIRGGSWNNNAQNLRSVYRNNNIGFRLVRGPVGASEPYGMLNNCGTNRFPQSKPSKRQAALRIRITLFCRYAETPRKDGKFFFIPRTLRGIPKLKKFNHAEHKVRPNEQYELFAETFLRSCLFVVKFFLARRIVNHAGVWNLHWGGNGSPAVVRGRFFR